MPLQLTLEGQLKEVDNKTNLQFGYCVLRGGEKGTGGASVLLVASLSS